MNSSELLASLLGGPDRTMLRAVDLVWTAGQVAAAAGADLADALLACDDMGVRPRVLDRARPDLSILSTSDAARAVAWIRCRTGGPREGTSADAALLACSGLLAGIVSGTEAEGADEAEPHREPVDHRQRPAHPAQRAARPHGAEEDQPGAPPPQAGHRHAHHPAKGPTLPRLPRIEGTHPARRVRQVQDADVVLGA